MECGRVIFGKYSKFSMMCCRKCNFVLIDIEVKILLAFLVSYEANVRLYQKNVFVFLFSREKLAFFKYLFSKSPVWSPNSEVFILHVHFHYFRVNGQAKQL